jgi:hypothetical protein
VPGSGRYVSTQAKIKLDMLQKGRLKNLKCLAFELYKDGVSIEEMTRCIRSVEPKEFNA